MAILELGAALLLASVFGRRRQGAPVSADDRAAKPRKRKPGIPSVSALISDHGCAAAEGYVLALHEAGFPSPPGWDHLSCRGKILAVASIGGPGTVAAVTAALYGSEGVDAAKRAEKEIEDYWKKAF